jgi:transcriptional/translational regulatory protein YebC/TACO1
MVSAATDNRNRTGQEIKNLFERAGGSLAGPGAVSFNFENKGLLVVSKSGDPEAQMLSLIDLGVEDMEEMDDGIEVYVSPEKLSEVRAKLEAGGFTLTATELSMKPKTFQVISDPNEAKKALAFLDSLEEHEDVQKVYTNMDIPANIVSQISA